MRPRDLVAALACVDRELAELARASAELKQKLEKLGPAAGHRPAGCWCDFCRSYRDRENYDVRAMVRGGGVGKHARTYRGGELPGDTREARALSAALRAAAHSDVIPSGEESFRVEVEVMAYETALVEGRRELAPGASAEWFYFTVCAPRSWPGPGGRDE